MSSDEGKKPDADNKNAETDKKAKPKKKQSRKKKKAAKKAEAKKAGVKYALAEDSGAEAKGAERAQEGAESGENEKDGQTAINEAQEAAEGEIEGDSTPEMTERERRRGYTDAEADAARAIIKDFDTMPRSKRLAITAFVRSCGGNNIPASFKKHAAAMMAHWRKGLWIIVDNKSTEKGFYRSFPDGSRLIVVNPAKATGKGATDIAYMHELGHDIWTRANSEMRKELYALATEGTTREERIGVRDRYRAGFEARGLKINNEVIREEIFTEFMSKALGNPKFFDRFDMSPTRKKGFWQMMKSTYRMAKCFFGKDKQLYMRSERMATAIARVMGAQMLDLTDIRQGDMQKYSQYKYKIRYAVDQNIDATIDKAINNKGNIQEKYNQKVISDVPDHIADMVSVASNGKIDISQKKIAVNGDDIWHEFQRRRDDENEIGRRQIPMSAEDIKEAVKAIYNPDIIEAGFTDTNNPTQRQSFVYAKKTSAEHYIVVEAVGGKYNPNIVPVMMAHINADKWNDWIGKGKTIGEMLYENDGKLRGALDVAQNKASRVIVAQFASSKAIANTPHSPRLNNSIPQNAEKSTSKAKKVSESDGIVDRKSLDDDLFDKDTFFANAMENGGVISHEEAEAMRGNRKPEPEKSQTAGKKPKAAKTAKELEEENKALNKRIRELERANDKLAEGVGRVQRDNREKRSEGRKQEHAAEVAERKAKRLEGKLEAERINNEKLLALEKQRMEEKTARAVRDAQKATENAQKNAEKHIAHEQDKMKRESADLLRRESRAITRIIRNVFCVEVSL